MIVGRRVANLPTWILESPAMTANARCPRPVDNVKFRGLVVPGDRLIIVATIVEMRGKRRNVADTQGFVNGQMVFEGRITGVIL